MYHSPGSAVRRSSESEDRRRRDSRVSINTQQLPPYNNANSPTQYSAYSPANGTHPQSPYSPYPPSRPSTSGAMPMSVAMSPRLGPPPSPKLNGPVQRSPVYAHRDPRGSYYDQNLEHESWSNGRYPAKSPIQVPRAVAPSPEEDANNTQGQSRPSSLLELSPGLPHVSLYAPLTYQYSLSTALPHLRELPCPSIE
ncbi:MAG: hypothetical protein Q9191_007418 [Dirinaria sp. TL-2023a]